jgi:SAM-dependent methyltransferase
MSNLQMVPCPLCEENQRFLPVNVTDHDEHIASYGKLYQGVKKSTWLVCGNCGFLHQNPRPTVENLNYFYANGEYFTQRNYELSKLRKFYKGDYDEDISFIQKHVPLKRASVFDIGCGLGFALNEFKQLGWQCYGIEPDEHRHRFAKEKLELTNTKLGIFGGSFEPLAKVDLVFSHHAFEHFGPYSLRLRAVLGAAAGRLGHRL